MSAENKTALTAYVAEQIADYMSHHATGNDIAANQIKNLEKAIHTICVAAYPEHADIIAKQAPQIVRTTLDMEQLGLADKVQRIIDAMLPQSHMVKDIINEITNTKTNALNPSHIAKSSLAGKLHTIQTTAR